jgi:hypothetical protein
MLPLGFVFFVIFRACLIIPIPVSTVKPNTMNDLLKRFGSFFLLVMLAISLQAQDFCIQFESLETGDVFGDASGAMPGDVFLEEDDVPVSLQNFFNSNGSTSFLNVFVEDSNTGILLGMACMYFQ